MPPSAPKKTNSAIWVSLLFGLSAQLLFGLEVSSVAAVLLYALAGYFFVMAVEAVDSDSVAKFGQAFEKICNLRFAGWKLEWLLVAALLFLAAFFRLYRIHSQPASLWLDESLTALNALEIIDGKNAPLWGMTPLDRWRPDWVKTSNLYLYYVVLVFKIFGTGYLGLKMVSLLPAIGSVAASYFLFKEISNRAVAFVSAFLLAVSQWHVTISRWGWDAVLMSFLQLVCYGLLLRGLRTGERWQLILSGVVMGLCLYTYIASWIALLVALIFIVLEPVCTRRAVFSGFQNVLFFLTACGAGFAPIGAHYLNHPTDLTVRVAEVSLPRSIQSAQEFRPLWENGAKYALFFNSKGDSNPRHGLPRAPSLDFLAAIFFFFGTIFCLRCWRHSPVLLMLLWFVLGLQAGLLADPGDAPNAYRIFMISPVVCYFSGTGIVISLDTLSPMLNRWGRMILIVLLMGSIGALNYWAYFIERLKLPGVWAEEARDGGLPLRIVSLKNNATNVAVDPALLWKIVVANGEFLNYHRGEAFDLALSAGSLFTLENHFSSSDEDQPLIYIYSPVFTPMVRSLFPDRRNEVAVSPFGEPLYGLIYISRADLARRLASVDVERLATAIQKTALFYREQANSDAEVGPRRMALYGEYQRLVDLDPRKYGASH